MQAISIFKRVSTHWEFWDSQPEFLPRAVQGALISQYHLTLQSLAELRMVGKAGVFANRKVQNIRNL